MAAKKTFEENMARLEEIVGKLEKGDAPLSDSLKLFEEGTKLIAQCRTEQADEGPRWCAGGKRFFKRGIIWNTKRDTRNISRPSRSI